MRAGNIVTTSGDVSTPPGGAPCSCGDSSVIDLELAPADLAAIRFHPDPVWETVASLGVLAHPAKHPLHRDLLDRVRDPDWDHDLLVGMMASDRWYPTTLAPVPLRTPADPVRSLAAVADTDEDIAGADLETLRRTFPHQPRWRTYTVPRLLEDTAAALVGYFDRVMAPLWERVDDITQSDIAYRSSSLASDGVGVTLGELTSG